jgi:translation initiation factor 4E
LGVIIATTAVILSVAVMCSTENKNGSVFPYSSKRINARDKHVRDGYRLYRHKIELTTGMADTTQFKGIWTLWYFNPKKTDWSLTNYEKVADISNASQFWTIVRAIPKDAIECGYFFFMRRGVRPIWEVPENENGGSWSKKIATKDIHEIALDLMVHAATEAVLTSRGDTFVGVSTSPKGDFNIVKLWNTNASITSRALLNTEMKMTITDDVVYTPHNKRGTGGSGGYHRCGGGGGGGYRGGRR